MDGFPRPVNGLCGNFIGGCQYLCYSDDGLGGTTRTLAMLAQSFCSLACVADSLWEAKYKVQQKIGILRAWLHQILAVVSWTGWSGFWHDTPKFQPILCPRLMISSLQMRKLRLRLQDGCRWKSWDLNPEQCSSKHCLTAVTLTPFAPSLCLRPLSCTCFFFLPLFIKVLGFTICKSHFPFIHHSNFTLRFRTRFPSPMSQGPLPLPLHSSI